MAIVEDDGLLLRSMRFRETSRIATYLTRQHGKVHVIAKAARESKSPFGGALDVPARTRLIFYLKKNRELHLLKAAWIETPFLQALACPAAYHLTCATLEFVSKVVPDEDPCPEVFASLAHLLEDCNRDAPALCALAPRAAAERAGARLKAFQIQTVAALGYAPQLAACARCGADVDRPGGFGVPEGGLLCRRCAREGEVVPISAAGVRLLRALTATTSPADATASGGDANDSLAGAGPAGRAKAAEGAAPASGVSAAEREAAQVIEAFLRYHLTGYQGLRSLRSLADWTRIRTAQRSC